MDAIFRDRIDHPSAWTSAGIGGKTGLIHRIAPEQGEALAELVASTRHLPPTAVRREDFDSPPVAALAVSLRDAVMHGRGVVVLSGLDMTRLSLDDYQRIFWGLGTRLGTGVAQSAKGDRIGRVEKVENDPTGRGYQGDMELMAHTDFHEVLALACFSKSATGGESGIVSSLALHNLLLEERPDLLPPLYEGYYHASAGTDAPVSESKVPIFACVDGQVSCYYHGLFMVNAAKRRGEELPADLREAIAYLNDLANDREGVRADFMLEPGEMIFWHNFTQLHSRRSFTNSGDHRRLLLRLWLNVERGRPMPASFHERARFMDEMHETGRAAIDYRAMRTEVA